MPCFELPIHFLGKFGPKNHYCLFFTIVCDARKMKRFLKKVDLK